MLHAVVPRRSTGTDSLPHLLLHWDSTPHYLACIQQPACLTGLLPFGLCATCRVLWGLAQLGHAPAPLLSAVTERLQVPGVLAGFSVSQLALSTSAFVALDLFPGEHWPGGSLQ